LSQVGTTVDAVSAPRRDGERLHRVVKAVATPVYRGCWRMRVEGRSNVPSEGGVIVAANHVSFFDSVVLIMAVRRTLSFVGKVEYLDSWKTRRLLRRSG
jgi:1-acyl-sn-glycerol-3-phosphate acyltransferase